MNSLNPHNNNQEEGKESQKEPEGVAILIDGNNFCKNLESLGFYNILDFLFDDFTKFLAQDRKIVENGVNSDFCLIENPLSLFSFGAGKLSQGE